MRNFDDELPDELAFIAAGETFTMALASPQVLAEFEDAEEGTTAADAIALASKRTTAFLQEGDRERWEKLLADGKVPYVTLAALQTWMVEVQTGRPTELLSPSAGGPGSTARTSKAK